MSGTSKASVKILIDHSKQCDLSNVNEYRTFYRRLQSLYKVEIDKECELNLDRLHDISLVILSCATKEFDSHEIRSLCNYVENGGNLLIFGTEGTERDNNEQKQKCLNLLLSKFGMRLNYDSLIRMVYSESYFHPKEAKIEDCVVNSMMADSLSRSPLSRKKNRKPNQPSASWTDDEANAYSVVYPFGCTLGITSRNVTPLISSQEFCFPKLQTLGALYEKAQMGGVSAAGNDRCIGGSVIVYGAAKSFSDAYIGKEDNLCVLLTLVDYLTSAEKQQASHSWLLSERNKGKLSQLKQSDNFFSADNDDYKFNDGADTLNFASGDGLESKRLYNDKHIEMPNIAAIADTVQSCLEQPPELKDFDHLFDFTQFSFSNHLYKKVMGDLYHKLGVEISSSDENQNHLTLIKPQFEVPLPPLQPAVFLPTFLEPMPPKLELFDIDNELQSTEMRLVTFFNKINSAKDEAKDVEKDLEIYVQGCAEILGIVDKVNQNSDERKSEDEQERENENQTLTQTQKCMKILHIVASELIDAKTM